jgi:ribonuclease HI
MSKQITLWTDGACSGNPGMGGWGVLMRYADHEKELCGGEAMTTNNRMELMAAIAGIEALKEAAMVTVVTDSTYVKNGITQWLAGWKARGWKTASGSAVKNQDLWVRLEKATQAHKITWEWVKGHSGHAENDRADALARQGMGNPRN